MTTREPEEFDPNDEREEEVEESDEDAAPEVPDAEAPGD